MEDSSTLSEPEESVVERSLSVCNIDINLKSARLPGILPDVDLAKLRNVGDIVEAYKGELQIIHNSHFDFLKFPIFRHLSF